MSMILERHAKSSMPVWEPRESLEGVEYKKLQCLRNCRLRHGAEAERTPPAPNLQEGDLQSSCSYLSRAVRCPSTASLPVYFS